MSITSFPRKRESSARDSEHMSHAMLQPSYVYILASERNGTLYIGVTTDIVKRCYEHKNGMFKGFSSRYKVDRLVHYEVFEDVMNAIAREKALKKWNRAWKLALIEKTNPEWRDLYPNITQ